MAKRVDNDSTMEVSASQLVPGGEKRPQQPPGVAKNDVSMWIGNVVGANDFQSPKKRRPQLLWGRLIVAIVLVLGVIGAGVYFLFLRPHTTSQPVPAAGSAGSASMAMPAAAPLDASIDAPIDAPVDAAVDAAVPEDAAVADAPAEATSATQPINKKKPAKKAVKKPATKKKKTH